MKVPLQSDGSISLEGRYDLDGWTLQKPVIREDVVKADGEEYLRIKLELLRDTALLGLFSTAAIGINSFDDARHFFAGVAGSLGYLLALTFKADSVSAGEWSKLQSYIGKTRYLLLSLPFLVLAYDGYAERGEVQRVSKRCLVTVCCRRWL